MRLHVHESERHRRRQLENSRLAKDVRILLTLRPNIVEEETNPAVTELAAARYLGKADMALMTVSVDGASTTLLIISRRSWHDAGIKERLILLKRAARRVGHRCLIVPQSFIRRQPRLAGARMVAASSLAQVRATDRMAVMGHLALEPGATLQDCAALVSGRNDPIAVILAMVLAGEVEFDSNKTLSPFSCLYLRA